MHAIQSELRFIVKRQGNIWQRQVVVGVYSDFPLVEIDLEETERAVADLQAIVDRAEIAFNRASADYGKSIFL